MVKYYFDKEKKEDFLNFWNIQNIEDFETLDTLSFAFRLSQLYYKSKNQKKNGDAFAYISFIVKHCLNENIAEIKNNRLSFNHTEPFIFFAQEGNKLIKELETLNLICKIVNRRQLSLKNEDKITWTNPLIQFFSHHRLLLKVPAENISGENFYVDKDQSAKYFEENKKITFNNKSTKKIHQTLCKHQGIALFVLNEKDHKAAVNELLQKDLAEIVLIGLGGMPGLLLKQSKSKQNKENPTKNLLKIQDQILLAHSYLKRRFINNLLTVEQLFLQKKALVVSTYNFLPKNDKNKKNFLQKEVFEKWEKRIKSKSKNKNIKTLPFKEKTSQYITIGMKNLMPLVKELSQWLELHCAAKEQNSDEMPIFSVEKKYIFAAINRQRFLQCKRPFRYHFFKIAIKKLKKLDIATVKADRLIFLTELFTDQSHPQPLEQNKLNIDSDMTMTAYIQEMSLKNLHFFSRFCQTTYTEYVVQFEIAPSLATFSWYSGLTQEKILHKIKKLTKVNFFSRIEEYFNIYFEHAKVAELYKISTISFSSRNFFLSAKHLVDELLKESPHKKKFLAIQEKKIFLFFDKPTKILILDFLKKQNLIQKKPPNKKQKQKKV